MTGFGPRLRHHGLIGLSAVFAAIAGAPLADASPVEDFYKDRQVTLVVGSAPGGGFDAYSRLLARHIDRYIPGKPNIVVQNRDGASGIIAANYLANIAPRDGSTFGIVQRQVLVEPLFGNDKLKLDATKLSWIGSLNTEWSLSVSWHTSGLDSLDDALKREFPVATDAPASDDYIYPAVLNNVLGTKFKIVPGYKSKAEERLSLERGETAAMVGWAWSAVKATAWHQIEAGTLRVFVFLAPEKRPGFEQVPTVYDYAKTDEQRQILDFIFGPQVIGRPYFAPPDVPRDRLAALQTAFDTTVKDTAFLADAAKQKLDIEPVKAAELQRRVAALYATPRDIIEKAKAARIYRPEAQQRSSRDSNPSRQAANQ